MENENQENKGSNVKLNILEDEGKNQRAGVIKKKKTQGRNKRPMSFSLDKEIGDRFENYCEEHMLNKSRVLEMILKEYMENNDI